MDTATLDERRRQFYEIAEKIAPRQLVGNRPEIEDDEIVEDSLVIDRVEPGKVWFEGGIGPFEIPEEVTVESETGWEVWIVAGPANGKWHLRECGMVYP